MFKKATKEKQKLRLLIEGASGSGKTYSALLLAKGLKEKTGQKIALIDTEKGSASLYSSLVDFDVCDLEPDFTPEKYIKAIKEAEQAGYGILIIDSITHEWSGKGGCLDIQTALGGKFNDWAKVTPRHNAFIDAILQSNMHIIGTARTKTDYALEDGFNKAGGKTTKPVKVGLKTEQREGMDYEFTIVFRVNENHMASANKDRTSLFNGIDEQISEETGYKLYDWLNDGRELTAAEVLFGAEDMPEEDKLNPDFDILAGLESVKTKEEFTAFYQQNFKSVQNKTLFNQKAVEVGEKLGIDMKKVKEKLKK